MKIVLLTFFYVSVASSCEVSLHKYLYIFNNNSLTDYISKRSSNCSDKQKSQIFESLNKTSGTLNTLFLKISESTIKPKIINIVTESEIIRKALSLTDEFKISSLNRSIPGDNIYSETSQSFRVSCSGCQDQGRFSYTIENQNNKGWGEISLLKKKYAYIANDNIKAFTKDLSEGDFSKTSLFGLKNKNSYITDIKDLKFYKINRHLKQNQPLLKSMLSPKTLVKYGDIVTVVAKTNNIQLSIKAKAKSRGVIGDTIQLKNLNSKKIITGTITNFNEVEIKI